MSDLQEVGSREARKEWRKLLDTVMKGDRDVVISRHGQEIAALIPARDYDALSHEVEDVRLSRLADTIYEQYLEGKSPAQPYEEVRSDLRKDE